jgi:hypothetical protein
MSVAVPAEISVQIKDASEFFAIVLKNREAGDSEEIPDWLSMKAQNWIAKNSDAFGKLVLGAYQRLNLAVQGATRPIFILPDPGAEDLISSVAVNPKR